jgi:uncharacterized membrane protein YecN with MAPEG domain
MEMTVSGLAMPITLAFASINALIFLVLSILVVRGRVEEEVAIGSGGKPRLELKIRVHGNFAEYVPLALLLMALLEAAGYSATVLCLLGTVLTLGRLSHAIGLSRGAKPNAFRFMGTLATWIIIAASAVMGLHATLF